MELRYRPGHSSSAVFDEDGLAYAKGEVRVHGHGPSRLAAIGRVHKHDRAKRLSYEFTWRRMHGDWSKRDVEGQTIFRRRQLRPGIISRSNSETLPLKIRARHR